jgi:hypothetical protein
MSDLISESRLHEEVQAASEYFAGRGLKKLEIEIVCSSLVDCMLVLALKKGQL